MRTRSRLSLCPSLFFNVIAPTIAVGQSGFHPAFHTAEPPLAGADGEVVQASAQLPAQPMSPANLTAIPSVAVVIVAPSFVPHGKDVDLRLRVENISSAAAHDVQVTYPLPKAAQLVKSDPKPSAGDAEPVWQLGTLAGGSRKEVTLTVAVPPDAGELHHAARVRFEHSRKASTRIARPEVTVRPVYPKQIQQYDVVTLRLEIVNTGLLEVSDVLVSHSLPEGMMHSYDALAGLPAEPARDPRARTWPVKRLGPGEVRVIDYRVVANRVGPVVLAPQAGSADGARHEAKAELIVVAPKLELNVSGPSRRGANQQAVYQVTVRNAGSFAMRNIAVTDRMPPGVDLVAATDGGSAFDRDVQWIIPVLQPGESRLLTLTTSCAASGRAAHQFAAAYRGARQTSEVTTEFEAAASLKFDVRGSPEAVTVGSIVRYTLTIENTGAAPASSVRPVVTIPDSLTFVSAEPASFRQAGNRVAFDPGTVAASSRLVVHVTARAVRPDSATLTVDLSADQLEAGPLRRQDTTIVTAGRGPQP